MTKNEVAGMYGINTNICPSHYLSNMCQLWERVLSFVVKRASINSNTNTIGIEFTTVEHRTIDISNEASKDQFTIQNIDCIAILNEADTVHSICHTHNVIPINALTFKVAETLLLPGRA